MADSLARRANKSCDLFWGWVRRLPHADPAVWVPTRDELRIAEHDSTTHIVGLLASVWVVTPDRKTDLLLPIAGRSRKDSEALATQLVENGLPVPAVSAFRESVVLAQVGHSISPFHHRAMILVKRSASASVNESQEWLLVVILVTSGESNQTSNPRLVGSVWPLVTM